MSGGTVVTLQSGSSRRAEDRPDWTPIAQRPDRYGIMAHTPDPRAYHYDAGGRVIIPRATHDGGSRGFSADGKCVLNIDPSDPVRGTGGITVDLAKIDKRSLKQAVAESEGDATMAWAIASQQTQNVAPAAPPPQREAPKGYGGYVVPQATWSGGQVQPQPVPSALNGHSAFQPAQIRPAVSPAIQQSQGAAMAIPTPIPMNVEQQPQYQQQPEQMQPPPQQVYQQPQYQQQPPLAQQPVYQPQYQQAPPPPAPGMDAMMQMMAQMMGQFTQAIQSLKAPPPTPAPVSQPPVQRAPVPQQPPRVPPVPAYQDQDAYEGVPGVQEGEEEEQPWNPPKPRPVAPEGPPRALPQDTGLGFLTATPSKPQLRVTFDLGKGGIHGKRFHAIAKQGVCLSLIYDDRYDGDRFIPTETGENETIKVRLPERLDDEGNKLPPETFEVAVPNFHQAIGCLDILNLIIVPPEATLPRPQDLMP